MKKLKSNLYLIYTILFMLISIVVFFSFIKSEKSFIWQTDGFKQHYVILENFNQTIRNLINNISTFSWNSGLGLDNIGQFSYYILGDPFAYLSLLFPMKYLKYAYSFLIILRIYCTGLSFIFYCKYNQKAKYGTLIGALMYTFCGYILYASIRHPFFTNAAILLPLMFSGIDRILKEDKYILFTFISALSAISNYYFFYMITILTFIYAIIKYVIEYRQNGLNTFLIKFSKALLSYIIGTLIASIFLLPTIYTFINAPRSGTSYTYYNLDYYIKLFFMNNNNTYWSRTYVPSIILVIIPISILNMKKNVENKSILINLLLQTIILLIPFLGSIMNGFSFQSNRWVFGYAFMLSYLVTINIKSNLKYSKKELLIATIFIVFYTIMWIFFRKYVGIFPLISIMLAIAFLLIIIIKNTNFKTLYKFCNPCILLILGLNIVLFSFYLFKNYSKEFIKFNELENKYSNFNNKIYNFDEAINYIKNLDNSLYRIGTNVYASNNLSLKYNYKSLNTYLSIGNKYITNLSKDLLILNNAKTNPLRELDSRTQITTLLGCKYYIVSKENCNYVPYGYKLIHELSDAKSSTYIYENKNSLPLGIFYNNYMLTENYITLSPLEKEQIILKTAVIDNSDPIYNYTIKNNTSNTYSFFEVKYKIQKNSIKNNKLKVSKKSQSFNIKINDNIENCELYLLFENLEYLSTNEYIISTKYNKIMKKQVVRDKITSPYYEETPNILINLGYRDKHSGTIKFSFSEKGTYTFDNIKLIAVPMNIYESNIDNLKKCKFNISEYSNSSVSGTINNTEDGILQLSTSYSTGWTAYVDGIKTNIINVNRGFVGIPLKKGNHTVEFVYYTPYLKLGIILSLLGIILFIILYVKKDYLK